MGSESESCLNHPLLAHYRPIGGINCIPQQVPATGSVPQA